MKDTLRFARRYLASIPLSIGFAALLLVTAVIAGTILQPASKETLDAWSAGVTTTVDGGRWWSILSALGLAQGPVQLIVGIVLALVLLGVAERLLGLWRTVLAMVVTGVVGVALGVLLQWAGSLWGEWWADGTRVDLTLDPLSPIFGAVMTASAFMSALWRRRTRITLLAFLLMFVLYDGDTENVYRLIAAIAGLVLGVVLARDAHPFQLHRSSHRETRTLLATVLTVTAIGPLISIANPNGFGPLSLFGSLFSDPLPDRASILETCGAADSLDCDHALAVLNLYGVGPIVLTFVPLILLLVAAWGLRKGRRFALWLAVGVNLALAGLAAFSFDLVVTLSEIGEDAGPLDIGEIIVWVGSAVAVPLGIAIVLLINRRHFTVLAPRKAYIRFATVTAVSFVVLALLYSLVAVLTFNTFVPVATWIDLPLDVPKRFIPINFVGTTGEVYVPTHPLTLIVFQWVGPIFWAIVVWGTLLVFRATDSRVRAGDDRRIRQLLHRGGGGTLGFMATWPGNVYWFSDDGEAAVAYRVINGVAITLSDPICRPERGAATIEEFTAFCDRNAWIPVFYSVHEEYLPVFKDLGWEWMPVGEETLMHPIDLELTGKPWQKVRQALNRGLKDGVRAEWTSWDELSLPRLNEVVSVSEQWVAEKELPEMGFTLGGMDELRDPEVKLMLAIGADDKLQAVTSWLPMYEAGVPVGWTIDFMRRADGSMNGIMEFVIVSAALHMKEEGARVLSLSGAPLASAPLAEGEEPPEPTVMSGILGFLAKSLEPAYGFSSLFRFKAKFNPTYSTIYMTYPDPLALPSIAAAIGKAYLPEMTPAQGLSLARTLVKPRA